MNCNDCCYNLSKDGHSYCTYEEGECVKISVLEKENARLLHVTDEGTSWAHLKSLEQTLTKAKEIIKSILPYMPKENIEGIYEIVEQAEQFLRED